MSHKPEVAANRTAVRPATVSPGQGKQPRAARQRAVPAPRLTKEALFAPFNQSVARNHPSLGYRLAVLGIAILVVLLPVVYMALIGAVGWGIWWYATNIPPGFGILEAGRTGGRAILLAMLGYGSVYVIAGVLLLLMVKPLWPRREEHEEMIGISRQEQPLLYEFVDRLCRTVRAPSPDRIVINCHVNAAAGVRKGLLGFGGDMTLVIGMPLVAGMSLRQFTGVLAHEFGHFAQGGAAYTERLVASTMNTMGRAIYERDGFDLTLQTWAHNGESLLFGIIGHLCLAAIWIVRRILWVLFYIGNRLSFGIRRQREYDADRYEARVAGSDQFADTSNRLLRLNLAAGRSYSRLRQSFAEKILVDDLPALIAAEAGHVSDDTLRQVRDEQRLAKPAWHDTHPLDHLRVEAAQKLKAPGLFDVEGPARLLFRDFGRLCKEVTLKHYRLDHGLQLDQCRLIPTKSVIADEQQREDHLAALKRFAQDLVHAARPIFPDHDLPAPTNPQAALEALRELRVSLRKQAAEGRAAHEDFERCEQLLLRVEAVRAMFKSGLRRVKLDEQLAAELKVKALKDPSALVPLAQQCEGRRKLALATLERVQSDFLLRLHLALHLDPQVPPDSEKARLDRQSAALRTLDVSHSWLREVRRGRLRLIVLLSQIGSRKPDETMVGAIISEARKCAEALNRLRSALGECPYPYPLAQGQMNLAAYIVPERPDPQMPPQVEAVADTAMERWQELYLRLMSDRCARAEDAEKRLGLKPLPIEARRGPQAGARSGAA